MYSPANICKRVLVAVVTDPRNLRQVALQGDTIAVDIYSACPGPQCCSWPAVLWVGIPIKALVVVPRKAEVRSSAIVLPALQPHISNSQAKRVLPAFRDTCLDMMRREADLQHLG
jgi:hypothetical protein